MLHQPCKYFDQRYLETHLCQAPGETKELEPWPGYHSYQSSHRILSQHVLPRVLVVHANSFVNNPRTSLFPLIFLLSCLTSSATSFWAAVTRCTAGWPTRKVPKVLSVYSSIHVLSTSSSFHLLQCSWASLSSNQLVDIIHIFTVDEIFELLLCKKSI